MWILGMVSAMLCAFLWAGYSEAELVLRDVERRRAAVVPRRQRLMGWVRDAPTRLPGFGPDVQRELTRIGWSLTRYVELMVVVGGMLALVFGWDLTFWLAPWGFVIGAGVIRYWVHVQYTTWLTQVVAQMGDVIVLLKARLQAGETVRQAVRHVLPQLPMPVRQDWEHLVEWLDAGIPFGEAIGTLIDQIPDRDVATVLQQLAVYDRDSVPDDPFGTLAAHLSRMKLVKRDYLIRRSTQSITIYTGLAFLTAMVSVAAPVLYSLWINTVGGMPL